MFFWAEMKIDGFRCDMVEMVPVEFWEWAIPQVKTRFPALFFIGEVYNPALYFRYLNVGKFDFLYDKVRYVRQSSCIGGAKGKCELSHPGLAKSGRFWIKNAALSWKPWWTTNSFRQCCRKFWNNAFCLGSCRILWNRPIDDLFWTGIGRSRHGKSGFSGDDGKTTILIIGQCLASKGGKTMVNGMDPNFWNRKRCCENPTSKSWILLRKIQRLSLEIFDLQYANQNNDHYNHVLNYTFLRYSQEEKILVVCSFSSQDQWLRIVIPDLAWTMAGLDSEGHFRFTGYLILSLHWIVLQKDATKPMVVQLVLLSD